MPATTYAYWLRGTPYCTQCVECDDPALSPDEIANAVRGPVSEVLRCACCGERRDGDHYVPSYDVAEAARMQERTLADAREDFPSQTFAYFIDMADRWAALSKRQRAAAIAIARGSMDTATDLIGPRYLSREDCRERVESPMWDDITDLLFEIDEMGFSVQSLNLR